MSYYKEDFLSMVKKINMTREEKEKQKELEAKQREKERREREKEKVKSDKKYANDIFSRNKSILINKTLDDFMSKLKKSSFPPYEVSYTLAEGICNETTTSTLEKIIKKELLKEIGNIPNGVIEVVVEDNHIDHGHDEGDNRAGAWVYEYTEYRLDVKITYNF